MVFTEKSDDFCRKIWRSLQEHFDNLEFPVNNIEFLYNIWPDFL